MGQPAIDLENADKKSGIEEMAMDEPSGRE
jgi:hypothetical protein